MDRHELSLHHPHRDVTILCGTRRATVSARLMRAYLPAALSSSPSLLNRRHQLDLDDYIANGSCAPVRHGMLRPAKMTRICQELVDILTDPSLVDERRSSSNSSSSSTDAVSTALTDVLARAQLEDRRQHHQHHHHRRTGHRAALVNHDAAPRIRHPRTLSIFLALADLSHAFGSRRIGAVLSAFFSRHGERIVGTNPMQHGDYEHEHDYHYEDSDGYYDDVRGDGTSEHPHAVLLWAWSLAVAARLPSDTDRRACLRDLLRARPDVLMSGRYDGFAAAALPEGDAEELWAVLERAAAAAVDKRTRGDGVGLPPSSGWRHGSGGFGGGFEGRGRRERGRERDWERRRPLVLLDDEEEVPATAADVYVHERRERRVVRSSGLVNDDGDNGRPPLGLETYHRARRLADPDDQVAWKPRRHGYSGGGGLRGTLDSIKSDQRELRLDMHDVKDDLDELVEQVNNLGCRDRERLRRGRMDGCERWPEEREAEWISEWWNDSY